MSDTPTLPQQISSDGHELWGWAGAMSEYIHRQAEIETLRRRLRENKDCCGSCDKWMKSSKCPRERPGTGKRSGYSVGPSMNDISCNQFIESNSAEVLRKELTEKLNQLLAK